MAETPKPPPVPVVLELAPLPREQVGPFILLGLDKTAGDEEIEAHWAQRVKWARQKKISTLLEDINWARDVLRDFERRTLANAASLNVDTTDQTIKKLQEKFAGGSSELPCEPIDDEKDLSQYSPQVEIPDWREEAKKVQLPDVPMEFPIVEQLLRDFSEEPLDPWHSKDS